MRVWKKIVVILLFFLEVRHQILYHFFGPRFRIMKLFQENELIQFGEKIFEYNHVHGLHLRKVDFDVVEVGKFVVYSAMMENVVIWLFFHEVRHKKRSFTTQQFCVIRFGNHESCRQPAVLRARAHSSFGCLKMKGASPKKRCRKLQVKKTSPLKSRCSTADATKKVEAQQPRSFSRTEDEQIARAIRLKLHMFPATQVQCSLDDEGYSIPMRVKEKLRETKLSKCHIKTEWWNQLVPRHKLSGTLCDGLVAPLQPEPVRRELDDALKSAHDSNPAKRTAGKYISLLRHMGPCNRTDFFGLCKASTTSPSLSRSMAETLLPHLMKYIARSNMDKQEADYWAVLSPYFDNMMGESWCRAQASGVARASFLRANRDVLSLFFSMEAGTQVEAASSSPDNKPDQKDILLLVNSSMVGSQLFAPESLRGECENFLSEIKRRIYDVEMNGFEAEEIESFTKIMNHVASSLDFEIWREFDADDLEVEFLTTTATTKGNHPADQAQERLLARIKTLAVSDNKVQRYPWEQHLYGTQVLPGAPQCNTLPENVYFDLANARDYMVGCLGTGWQTVATMKATVSKFAAHAKLLDHTFWMDEYFLVHQYDRLIATHLENCLLQILPDEHSGHVDMRKVLNAARLLTTGDIVMSQEKDLKDKLMSATNLLSDMVDARGPLPTEASRFSDFLKRFLAKSLNFAMAQVTDIEPGDSSVTRTFNVFGHEAVEERYNRCAQLKDDSVVPTEDLKFFRTYRWHLNEVQSKKYEQWEKQSVATAKSRLVALRQAALLDVETNTAADKKQKKKTKEDTSASPVAPPLQKKSKPSEKLALVDVCCNVEAEHDSAEQANGLMGFFGARAT